MNATPSPKWSLDRDAFERLLSALGSDREAASREYEALRRRLIHFFDWRGARAPDVLADQTLDRLARKLEEGEAVANIDAYVRAIARFVLQEWVRQSMREQTALEALARMPPVAVAPSADVDTPCLQRCVAELPEESRVLIVAYYEGEGQVHLRERKVLADRLGLTYAALKKRAHRIRNRLEACIAACGENKPGHR